jgi:hypothetical protein
MQLPVSLEAQLYDFRRRVWTIKTLEAVGVVVFAVVVAYLFVFALDRFVDTPAWLRLAALMAALCSGAMVPWYFYRWVWKQRRKEQLALLLAHKLPRLGDQLLGIIELVRDESEQSRSPELCEAAIEQVAEDARHRNFRESTPDSRYRRWLILAVVSLLVAVSPFVLCPAAATNALARFVSPWGDTPRYTFAALEDFPNELIVAHGEPFTVVVRLKEGSKWQPSLGQATFGGQHVVEVSLRDNSYAFELPPQIDTRELDIRIGDARRKLTIVPTLRPELTDLIARVTLPDYLGRSEPLSKDVRGGSITLVKGSRATFTANATRDLATATVDGSPRKPVGPSVASPEITVVDSREMIFQWKDKHQLSGKEPFTLSVQGRHDERPSIFCEGLPRLKVVLNSEQLRFNIQARDDFGVKHVGMEWQGFENALVKNPLHGERLLAAGGTDTMELGVTGTFTATDLEIKAQPIRLRLFVVDYFEGRERVYSPTYVLYVLTPEQHAIWLTEQLSKWHSRSLEVRDREMQLYETNKELRDLRPEDLDNPETGRRIEAQATRERANGRRLSRLTSIGEELVRQASRNPEFGVGHLEKWAEMLQVLKEISANRMPSVADLLKEAANARQMAVKTGEGKTANAKARNNKSPMAGKNRAPASGSPSEDSGEKGKERPPVPSIVDVESSQQPLDDDGKPTPEKKGGGKPGLGLASTTLIGGGPKGDACPTAEKMEEAVEEQRDLLAEFEKVSNELNKVLANLEGSTLVKRLKAAARKQYSVAGRIGDQISDSFGKRPTGIGASPTKVFKELTKIETASIYNVSLIMDDMQAYFERRRFVRFNDVLEEMKEQDILGNLRQLSDDIPKEHGLSLAMCEYWSDSLDRWAEDLVDPASGGS